MIRRNQHMHGPPQCAGGAAAPMGPRGPRATEDLPTHLVGTWTKKLSALAPGGSAWAGGARKASKSL
eukprot:909001-Pyramimonas_sp.AAC.1